MTFTTQLSNAQAMETDEGRWPPGTVVADRYRILGLLGKGGMGEVYRAVDQRLAQTVALKFLPESFAHDPAMLARFYNEVRIARQVTHPNVCRVFDIGEVHGQPFLSMQFIDGENLATLLLRIGRLPPDKAVEIARKLCAGLAAAHTQNVLHRDLKPANIMLDNRGQVVITDFGLAGLAEDMRGAEIGSGTPAYMSPEQLAGTEVTCKSDIYALGLVLYEIFTGRKAFHADTLAEMIRLRGESRPADLSTVVRDIDPSVEKVILRCLDAEPANRPPSALAVSAALPGGDPLAAALAAGETPTPEMVAAAGSKEALKPAIALAMLVLILALLPTVPLFHGRFLMLGRLNLEMPPEALLVQAHKTLRQIGYEPGVDSAWSVDANPDLDNYEKYLKQHSGKPDYSPAVLNQVAPVIFHYRESPKLLVATGYLNLGFVLPNDPPANLSGMTAVRLDLQGKLLSFAAVPPQLNTGPVSGTPGDASNLFSAAGLDMQTFQPAPPLWAAPVAGDARTAWIGPFPGLPGNTLRVEAAWWNGKPVWFQLIPPWAKPSRMVSPNPSQVFTDYAQAAQVLIFLVGAGLLAWRNLHLGRGDRQGAFRLAVVIFEVALADYVLMAHGMFSPQGVFFIGGLAAKALWTGAKLWLAYLALEPLVRRRWPRILISWSRILSGKWRDPMVGRDVLVGIILGLGYALILMTALALVYYKGASPDIGANLGTLLGFRYGLEGILNQFTVSVSSGLILFLLLFLFRLVLRKEWLAALVLAGLFACVQGGTSDYPFIMVPAMALIYGTVFAVLLEFGLVSMMVAIFTVDLLMSFSITLNFGAWYGTGSLLTTGVIAVLALYAFRKSLGTQRAFSAWVEQ